MLPCQPFTLFLSVIVSGLIFSQFFLIFLVLQTSIGVLVSDLWQPKLLNQQFRVKRHRARCHINAISTPKRSNFQRFNTLREQINNQQTFQQQHVNEQLSQQLHAQLSVPVLGNSLCSFLPSGIPSIHKCLFHHSRIRTASFLIHLLVQPISSSECV